MQIIKYCMLFFVFVLSSYIGVYLSKKYVYRLQELEEIKSALNIFKTKIKFTYEPLSEIFEEISKNTQRNISNIFINAKNNMKIESAGQALEKSINLSESYLKEEDKQAFTTLSKLLGSTDIDGQISQIEVTESLIDKQIKDAELEKNKNEKLYKKLGSTIGLAIVVILI